MPTYTKGSNYGYTPSTAWCAVFIALFSLTAIVHSAQAARSKYWIIYPTLVLGAVIEVMGWSARLWSSLDVLRLDPFLMQICLLIMAPVFFSAYNYAVLGTAIHRLGPQYSILPPEWYFAIFITADALSLILQAIGGGQASSTAATGAPTQRATSIMVAGIIFQLITMGIFILCGIDFCIRAKAKRPYGFMERRIARLGEKKATKDAEKQRAGGLVHANSDNSATTIVADVEANKEGVMSADGEADLNKKWWIMMAGVAISSAMILVRGVFRSIELTEGWSGYLIRHEIYQNVLDGIPMVISVAVFNIINPLYVLPKKAKWGPYY